MRFSAFGPASGSGLPDRVEQEHPCRPRRAEAQREPVLRAFPVQKDLFSGVRVLQDPIRPGPGEGEAEGEIRFGAVLLTEREEYALLRIGIQIGEGGKSRPLVLRVPRRQGVELKS